MSLLAVERIEPTLTATRTHIRPAAQRKRGASEDPFIVKWGIILVAFAFLGLFIVLPLINVFVQAFSKGHEAYLASITESAVVSAITLTITSGALAILHAIDDDAPRWLEVVVLLGATAIAAIARYVALRGWVFGAHRSEKPVSTG